MKIAGPSNVVLLVKQLDNYSNVLTLISLELVAIGKTVAASSPGGQWLPFRGKITDQNRRNSIQKHPVLNQWASFLEFAGSFGIVYYLCMQSYWESLASSLGSLLATAGRSPDKLAAGERTKPFSFRWRRRQLWDRFTNRNKKTKELERSRVLISVPAMGEMNRRSTPRSPQKSRFESILVDSRSDLSKLSETTSNK